MRSHFYFRPHISYLNLTLTTRSGWAPNTGGRWKARLDQREAERFAQTLKDVLEGMLRKKRYGTIAELQAGLDHRLAWVQRPATPPGPSQPGEAAVAGHPRVPARQELKAA
ncbi:hypothetical protein Daud_0781 [Candidatus Desulforudis audaxviator MP104C]|uniref:Uncharacterized protein n=1 Tax=Desulforudis audaxviator (strain MP104C) TaxID=477974 RepID=B1I2T4_DESAP|nr:hypothetical protein [Candidatus Desulforudis audaxviator]ACA59303.1 hypothetical protein Daud_0781 [Candidatus Desulforudis audaxviator MP104C]